MRILSLDGGGVRGIFSATILKAIVEIIPEFDYDVIVGTSTGGIIALSLAYGYSPLEVVDFYKELADKVFKKSFLRYYASGNGLFFSRYDNKTLAEILFDKVGYTRLSQLEKKVIITTFDLVGRHYRGATQWNAKFFNNFHPLDGDVPIAQLALYTTAVPGLFPNRHGFIDGGVIANNPAMCAVAKVVNEGTPIEDIRLLSIGTGYNPRTLKEAKGKSWGLLRWAVPILPLIMDGSSEVVDYQCENILGEKMYRVQYPLLEQVNADSVDEIPKLEEVADNYIKNHPELFTWVEENMVLEDDLREEQEQSYLREIGVV